MANLTCSIAKRVSMQTGCIAKRVQHADWHWHGVALLSFFGMQPAGRGCIAKRVQYAASWQQREQRSTAAYSNCQQRTAPFSSCPQVLATCSNLLLHAQLGAATGLGKNTNLRQQIDENTSRFEMSCPISFQSVGGRNDRNRS
eukprot:INCI9906.2.p1 GENE.INCI9906.2~~INCI9906.2.p1  ORF type:complete len:143 (+),score=12.76 INCI9906.2:739-1167(+)